jgi:hypothetical protein
MSSQPLRPIDVRFAPHFSVGQLLADIRIRDAVRVEAAARAAGARLVSLVKPVRNGRQIDYVSEESLLANQRRAADFHILVLADHFRSYYSIRRLPAPAAVRYISRLKLANVRLRLSGHVTGTFAEAMAPWALNELGLATADRVFRLRRLEPSPYRYAPDLVINDQPPIPVEVKHALDESQINADRLSRGILQLAVGLSVMASPIGYLVICTGTRPPPVRYSIQVVPIGQ